MSREVGYGQYCPLALAAEFLCRRWTILVLRELLLGSRSFTDISKGVARMSRTLLASRLKELTDRGILRKQRAMQGSRMEYELTPAGKALSSVVFGMADWSQEWLQLEPSLENLDANHLMWSLRRSSHAHPDLPNPFVVNFYLSDQPPEHQNAWLVFRGSEVELCIIDQGFDVDVVVEATTRNLTRYHMGWCSYAEAVKKGELILRGPQKLTRIARHWLGRSRLAAIKKQPSDLLVS